MNKKKLLLVFALVAVVLFLVLRNQPNQLDQVKTRSPIAMLKLSFLRSTICIPVSTSSPNLL